MPKLPPVRRLLLTLWLFLTLSLPGVGYAAPGAAWVPAPTAPVARPDIPAPPGGWWVEDGLYARVFGIPEDRVTVRRLADHAAKSVPALGERLGVPAGGTMDVYLAPTRAFFSSMQPGETPAWAEGTAWAALGLVFLHAPEARNGTAPPIEQILDHEIVHVLLGRAFAPAEPPHWLQEGLAQYYAGELGQDDAQTLTGSGGPILPLAQITRGFPRDPVLARAAYAESADFVGWLANRHGEGALRGMIGAIDRGANFEDALRMATGEDPAVITTAWESQWQDPWLRVAAWARSPILWFVLTAALLGGWWRRRRRAQRRMEVWALEEEADRRRREAERLAWEVPVRPPLYVVHVRPEESETFH